MIMLTGIKAFEARWQLLKGPRTSAADNHLLMQSMGRLVDNYATQDEIITELPVALQGLFSCLVDAYLNGYWLEDDEVPMQPAVSRTLTPAMLEAKQRRQGPQQQPTAASEAVTYIVRERVKLNLSARLPARLPARLCDHAVQMAS